MVSPIAFGKNLPVRNRSRLGFGPICNASRGVRLLQTHDRILVGGSTPRSSGGGCSRPESPGVRFLASCLCRVGVTVISSPSQGEDCGFDSRTRCYTEANSVFGGACSKGATDSCKIGVKGSIPFVSTPRCSENLQITSMQVERK